jgi:DNA polymerase-3 subunit delta'
MSEALLAYPWQSDYWQTLNALQDQDRLPHAILLSGPEGIGKYRFAKAFAAYLLCEQPQAAMACGKCQSCLWCKDRQHPDFKALEPPEGKRQIAVDQVRELQSFAVQRAHREDGKKIVLIHPAEGMNTNAANALLKTLEEPAEQTLLLLVSHASSRLLPTIRSRCLQYAMKVPDPAASEAWLQKTITDSADLHRLMQESSGRPLTALALFESGGLERFKEYDQALAAMLTGKTHAVAVAETFAEHEPTAVLSWWVRRLQLLITRLVGADAEIPVPWDRLKGLDPAAIFPRLDTAQQSLAQLQRGAALNKRLLFEGILLDWQQFCHNNV